MIYDTKEEAELEARLNEEKLGGKWKVRKIKHTFYRERYPRDGFQPVRADIKPSQQIPHPMAKRNPTKKKRSAKQLANDKRLGEMARARHAAAGHKVGRKKNPKLPKQGGRVRFQPRQTVTERPELEGEEHSRFRKIGGTVYEVMFLQKGWAVVENKGGVGTVVYMAGKGDAGREAAMDYLHGMKAPRKKNPAKPKVNKNYFEIVAWHEPSEKLIWYDGAGFSYLREYAKGFTKASALRAANWLVKEDLEKVAIVSPTATAAQIKRKFTGKA